MLLAAFSCLQVLVLRFIDPPVSMVMLWRYGEALGEADWSYRLHYQWRDLGQMAPSLPISLVAAEDQRFPDHNGFDLQAIEKARDHNARGGRLRGASTISQQVAKNLFLWQGRSWILGPGSLVHGADRGAVAKGADPGDVRQHCRIR